MKAAVDLFEPSASDHGTTPRREWTGRSIFKLVCAGLALSLVYFIASHLPMEHKGTTGGLIAGFLFFWVLGGMLTVTLLALSDRQG